MAPSARFRSLGAWRPIRQAALALLALALPRLAGACAFCFGQADGSNKGLVRGFTIAFIVLIVTVMSMLAGIGATMITIERRRAKDGPAS